MITTLAVQGYRSLREVVLPLRRLTVVTGANGAGKSSLYRALRLLADCGQGRVISSLAAEGGLTSVLWAGPETLTGARKRGQPVQGTVRTSPVSVQLGFGSDELSYLIDLGLPQRAGPWFTNDPEIKREIVFAGPVLRPAAVLVERTRPVVQARDGGTTDLLADTLPSYRSMLTEFADPRRTPELMGMRHQIAGWRFYDGFRTDQDAPARHPQIGTRTPVLSHDGADLAAALATIDSTDAGQLAATIDDAFPGATLNINGSNGTLTVGLQQPGMLRTMWANELSDGTLRFLLWAAALHSREPPPLLVLNEPETSLHPDLLPALARLIGETALRTQVLVVSHSRTLIDALGVRPLDPDEEQDCDAIELELIKDLGETIVKDLRLLDIPSWNWGQR